MSDEGEKQQKTELGDNSADDSDLFQSIGVRYLIQNGSGFDRFLLAYNGYFLPVVSIFLWALFLAIR